MKSNWYEVWEDETHDVPYVLLLRPCEQGFEILDPADHNKRAFVANGYEEARMWLLEDEFELVGRKEIG